MKYFSKTSLRDRGIEFCRIKSIPNTQERIKAFRSLADTLCTYKVNQDLQALAQKVLDEIRLYPVETIKEM